MEPARAEPVLGVAARASPARVHAVPAIYRVIYWVFAVVCAAAFVACLAVPYFTAGAFDYLYLAFVESLVAGGLALLSASEALRLRERFAVVPPGLLRIEPGGRHELLRWDQIVRVRERPLLQRLEVSASQERVFILEYQLDGFDELAAELAARAPAAWRGGEHGLASAALGALARDSATTFQRHWSARVLPPVIAPVVIAGSIAIFGGVLILAWLLALVAGAAWLRGWRNIRLVPREVVIAYPFRTRRIPVEAVAAVELASDPSAGQYSRPGVMLALVDGNVLWLHGAREGDVALYGALRRHCGAAAPEVERSWREEVPS